MEPINVVTFLWGNWCAPHGAAYVNRLRRAVDRNLSVPYRFIAYVDRPEDHDIAPDIDVRRLESPSWLGCLPKLCAFNPANELVGRTIVLDLDTVVVGSLDRIAAYSSPFVVRAWYGGIQRNKWVPDGDTVGFSEGYGRDEIWAPFERNPRAVERSTGGRERYWYRERLRDIDMWQKHFPKEFVSYKNHCKRQGGRLPEGAALVSFHGNPRPHEVDLDWVREHWCDE